MENTVGTLRKAREEDIPQILNLVAQNSEKLLPRTLQDYMENLPLTWVVDERGIIVGCATLEVYSSKIAEIRSVAVHADRRMFGYGSLLVQAAVDAAKERDVHEIMVVTSNRHFFERLNFGACLNEKYALFWNGK